jgi:hypothetical protein
MANLYPDIGNRIEITRILTQKTAKQLNKDDIEQLRFMGFSKNAHINYKAGDVTERFYSIEDIIAEIPSFIERNNVNVTEVYYWRGNEKIIAWKLTDMN